MRTPREFYHMTPIVYSCELDSCPTCGMPMKVAYVSGPKAVHTMTGQVSIAHRPKRCSDPSCVRQGIICKSAGWQQLAPCHCTYGYDVVAHIGWQRQTGCQSFQAIRDDLHYRVPISESQVRHLYHERYLPLLACHERQQMANRRRQRGRYVWKWPQSPAPDTCPTPPPCPLRDRLQRASDGDGCA